MRAQCCFSPPLSSVFPIPKQLKPPSLRPPKSSQVDQPLAAAFVRLLNADPDASASGPSYYDPRPGDFAVGVVVSGTEDRLDVAVGADRLGTMLTKELLPLDRRELPELLCDPAGEAVRPGRVGVVRGEEVARGPWRPVVQPGTVVFAEVLGRTLSGRPLLSARRLFRRLAWHRVRQIMQLDEPIEVKIYEWNTGGLLTRIEGLRAFLPKVELMDKISTFTDLKKNVGLKKRVCITRMDEETNDLVISEKKAWEMTYLKEGTLLQGVVHKVFPYGAQVRITGTNRRITLSIAELESEPGLFLSDKEKVFSGAEEMAKRYRERLPVVPTATPKLDDDLPRETLPFDDEASLYANWKWFKFQRRVEAGDNNSGS